MKYILRWTTVIPILAWTLYFTGLVENSVLFQILAGILLVFSVMASVNHSEIIALRVGEPYGTIILAISITIIEVSIIVSLMISGGKEAASLARDTVFSVTMLILNGIVGLCLFIGGLKHHEQIFSKHSATISLVSIVSIVILTLVFPSFTTSKEGPYYSTPQLIFVSVACVVIYSFFLFAQTTRHRDYFQTGDEKETVQSVNKSRFIISLVFLLVCLGIVVLLAKSLSPPIENIIVKNNLPKVLVGIIIAAIILLPEGIAAILASKHNKLQTSLNLALGSALASIGLTIPAVSIVSIIFHFDIILGIDIKSMLLLGLSVFTVVLSLISGRTNIVYGAVLLVNLCAYIFLVINP
ncbi:MAG TPA: hypothetical protein VK179_20165 [Bacteroidales bacterium]|nr:hypothetical protein [Bacteroidales bacterium]